MPDAHREQWLAIADSAATNPGDVQNEEWTWLKCVNWGSL